MEPEFVPSPCRQICRLRRNGVCEGCGRTLREIEEWPQASAARRLAIREAAEHRMKAIAEQQLKEES